MRHVLIPSYTLFCNCPLGQAVLVLLGGTQLDEAGFSQNGCVMLLDTSAVATIPLRNKLPDALGRASRNREMQKLLKYLGCCVFWWSSTYPIRKVAWVEAIFKVSLVTVCFSLALAWWDVSDNLVWCRCSGSHVGGRFVLLNWCNSMLHLNLSFQLTSCSCSLGLGYPSLDYFF